MSKLIILYLFFLSLDGVCQKLPNMQLTGIALPHSYKIDGYQNEWPPAYQAYNKSTEIFYTIANDEHSIYLIIKAKQANMIKKIVMAGLSLTVYDSQDRKGNAVKITFPLLNHLDNWRLVKLVDRSNESTNRTTQE